MLERTVQTVCEQLDEARDLMRAAADELAEQYPNTSNELREFAERLQEMADDLVDRESPNGLIEG